MPRQFVAVDLGAESGRAVLGQLDGRTLALKEVHRFRNGPVRVAGHMHWDVLRIHEEILAGLAAAVRQHGGFTSLGVDTWGVDFGLLDRTGALVGNPFHYRDRRTAGVPEKVFERVPRAEVFDATGIQVMELNTLYQLYAMVLERAPALEIADTFLMMPDLVNYWLTGEKVCEYTEASTSQMFDMPRGGWAAGLLERLGIPTRILPRVVQPGTELPGLLPAIADQVGARGARVIAPASHDTASAVAAVPASGERYVYISSGTWSLMGTVTPGPVVTDASRELNFTNEGGVGGTIRLLKDITGLWLVQECRRAWARAGDDLSYDAVVALAREARPFQAFVDPDEEAFVAPDDMPRAVQEACARTGQAVPRDRGEIVRVALESLARKYRLTLAMLERIVGHRLDVIHVVGGGSQNQLLCQFAADACARPVLAGPVEATAIGNVVAQAIACGDLGSWAEGRELVRAAFPPRVYEPQDTAAWDEACARFERRSQPISQQTDRKG